MVHEIFGYFNKTVIGPKHMKIIIINNKLIINNKVTGTFSSKNKLMEKQNFVLCFQWAITKQHHLK